ncbi:hypothetical protein MBANPS3_011696 [Mucor bainieri]
MHFLPLYSFIILLMPFLHQVDLRNPHPPSVRPGPLSSHYSPLYANVLEYATPNLPKHKMPHSIVTADPYAPPPEPVTEAPPSSQPSNKYWFNPFKKSTKSSGIDVSGPVSSPKLNAWSQSANKYMYSPFKKSSTPEPKETSSGKLDNNTGSSVSALIRIPLATLQYITSPFVYIYRLFKKEAPIVDLPETPVEPEEDPLITEICRVLASSSIHYPDCEPASAEQEKTFTETTSTWSAEDQNGVKWKRVTEGEDKGCIFYLMVDPMPLKMSAAPRNDGTTDMTYYTKHTVAKYCPKDDNDVQGAHEFYKSLLEYIRKPTTFEIISNTKVLFDYSLQNVVQAAIVIDTFVLAAKKVFSVFDYRYWIFRVFLSIYLVYYMGSTIYTSQN